MPSVTHCCMCLIEITTDDYDEESGEYICEVCNGPVVNPDQLELLPIIESK